MTAIQLPKDDYYYFCHIATSNARSTLESWAEFNREDLHDNFMVTDNHIMAFLTIAWGHLDEEDKTEWKEYAERINAGDMHLLQELEVDFNDPMWYTLPIYLIFK